MMMSPAAPQLFRHQAPRPQVKKVRRFFAQRRMADGYATGWEMIFYDRVTGQAIASYDMDDPPGMSDRRFLEINGGHRYFEWIPIDAPMAVRPGGEFDHHARYCREQLEDWDASS